MITLFIVQMICAAAAALVSVLPAVDIPAWFTTSVQTVGDALGNVGQWVPFIPLGAAVAGIAFIAICTGIAWSIKLGRIAISLMSGGGGSAA